MTGLFWTGFVQETGQPSSRPIETAKATDAPSPARLADALLASYRKTECLSFRASVWQEGLTAEGEVRGPKEVARALVRMRGLKLRLDVSRGGSGDHLLDYFDDGKHLTEITAERRMETPVSNGRDLLLAESVGLDGCQIGHLLESWLSQSDSNTIAWAAQHIRSGRYLGLQDVDGTRCHAVRFRVGSPGPDTVVTDFTLFLDTTNYWIRKRVGYQRAFAADGDIVQAVRRTTTYTSIKTASLADDEFTPPATHATRRPMLPLRPCPPTRLRRSRRSSPNSR